MFAALLLVALVVLFRVLVGIAASSEAGWLHEISWLHNFQPMGAVFLCCAATLPKRLAWVLPFSALIMSNVLLNAVYGESNFTAEALFQYVAFGLVGWIGWSLRKMPHGRSFAVLGGGALAGALAFYILSNTCSWAIEPLYPKTVYGWVQSLTTGLPGYVPSWVFLRNGLASSVVFTALFWVCVVRQSVSSTTVPSLSGQSRKSPAAISS
jgi:hypothetical protein